MKTEAEIKNDVYLLLKKSPIMSAVTGKLSKRKRPINSKKEDVVISVLSSTIADRQEAFLNINVYVAQNDINGQYEEDSERLETLERICMDFLESVHGEDYWITMSMQKTLEVESKHENVINNRILYSTINI